MTEKLTGLDLLRAPFPANQISKLPKPTKQQTEAVKANFKSGIRCKLCGAWHHPDVVHLDYVGHAALTDRLLDADPSWHWEPCAFNDHGLPAFDQSGGLWIKLTVCGVTRLGYGHAAAKQQQDPGAREKEVIGDALRNAAMRFGAALDLWHKGDLHADDDAAEPAAKPAMEEPRRTASKPDDKPATRMITPEQIDMIKGLMPNQKTLTPQGIIEALGLSDFNELTFKQASGTIRRLQEECRKAQPQRDEALADEIPF